MGNTLDPLVRHRVEWVAKELPRLSKLGARRARLTVWEDASDQRLRRTQTD